MLFSTVFHPDLPEAEQVKGPSGPRLIPSGLDIASALGSKFANSLLAGEIEKYPPLGKVLEDLRTRFADRNSLRNETNIYNPWLAALALQWADDVASPGGNLDKDLWHAKRLQTGLASWATLRHATVLVNERTSAECGEAAFEPILMTPPEVTSNRTQKLSKRWPRFSIQWQSWCCPGLLRQRRLSRSRKGRPIRRGKPSGKALFAGCPKPREKRGSLRR